MNQSSQEQSQTRICSATTYVPNDFRDIDSMSNPELQKYLHNLVADNDAIETGHGHVADIERPSSLKKSIKNVDQARVILSNLVGGHQDNSERIVVHRKIHGQLYRRLGLAQESRSCVVCGESTGPSEISGRVTRWCTHSSWCCKPCIQNWIAAQLETQGWDRIACPECPRILSAREVRRVASEKTYKR